MAAKLRRDIEKLKSRLQAAPASETVRSVRLEGSGTVKLELAHVRAQPVIQVALIFADTNYPEAAVLLLCDSNDSVNSQLEDLSDAFQDGAALPAIVSAICARLDFPTCLADSSAGQPAAEMDREDEAEGSDIDHVSEGSEEEAEDTDDDAYDVAERDDEDLLKVVFQKVSRWELKEAAITKACSRAFFGGESWYQSKVVPGKCHVMSCRACVVAALDWLQKQGSKHQQITCNVSCWCSISAKGQTAFMHHSRGLGIYCCILDRTFRQPRTGCAMLGPDASWLP